MDKDAQIDIRLKSTADNTGIEQAKAKLGELKSEASQADALKPSTTWTAEDQARLDESWNRAIHQTQRHADKLKLDDSLKRSLADSADDLENIQGLTVDWERSLKGAGKSGAEAGDKTASSIGQASKGIIEGTQEAQTFREALTRVAGAAAMVYVGWEAGKAAGNHIYDYISRNADKAEKNLQKVIQRQEDLRKKSVAVSFGNYSAIDADNISKYYDRESEGIRKINELYQQRLAHMDRIKDSRLADLDLTRQMVETQKGVEESIIRQKTLTGQLTEYQAKQAQAALDRSTAEKLRELESERDRQMIEAAREKATVAESAQEQKQTRLEQASQPRHTRYTGSDYRQLYEQSRSAVKGSAQYEQIDASLDHLMRQIAEAENNLGQAASEKERKKYEQLIASFTRMQDSLLREREKGEEALRKLEKLEQSLDDSGLLPEMYADEMDRVNQIAERMEEARNHVKALREEVKASKQDIENARRELQEATAQAARNRLVRAETANASEVQRQEGLLSAQYASNTEKLARATESAKSAGESFLTAAAAMRESGDGWTRQGLAPGTIGNKVMAEGERIAGQGYATGTDIDALNKALLELKQSNYPRQLKDQIENMVGGLVRTMESLRARQAALQAPAQAQQTARERFEDGVYRLNNRGNVTPTVREAINQTKAAMKDGEIDRGELEQIKKALRTLNSDTASEASKEATKLITDAVTEYINAQNRKRKQSRSIDQGNNRSPLNREIFKILDEVLGDDRVDKDTEKPALEAVLAQIKARDSRTETDHMTIEVLTQMISIAEQDLNDTAALKSEMEQIRSRINMMQSQLGNPRNVGR